MPRRYKKRTYRRKPKSTNYLGTASKALSVAYAVKRLVNVEFKHHNVQQLNTSITDAGLIVQLSNVGQGDNSQQRDGGSCKFTSFRLAYQFRISQSAVSTIVRVMVVHDKQTNQAVFTLADLLFDATIQDAIFSPPNINNASRFNILYDRLHSMAINGNSANIARIVHKKLNLKTRYDAAVGDITDLTQDSLALVFIGDQATNDPAVSFNYRSRFIDN